MKSKERAMANSPFWPKVYEHDSPEAQEQYDELVERTGCSGKDSLACLKRGAQPRLKAKPWRNNGPPPPPPPSEGGAPPLN